jgi:hypothetical protein
MQIVGRTGRCVGCATRCNSCASRGKTILVLEDPGATHSTALSGRPWELEHSYASISHKVEGRFELPGEAETSCVNKWPLLSRTVARLRISAG